MFLGQRRGVTKRRRLYWLTTSVLVYKRECGGRGGVAESKPMSTAQLYTGAQINFGDLTPYLTYDSDGCKPGERQILFNEIRKEISLYDAIQSSIL